MEDCHLNFQDPKLNLWPKQGNKQEKICPSFFNDATENKTPLLPLSISLEAVAFQ